MSFIEEVGWSVSKSLRLDEALMSELEAEAEKLGVSFNDLLSRMVREYLDFGRYNHNRNFINMGSNTLKCLLNSIETSELYQSGYFMGGENPMSRVFKAGYRPNWESLLVYLRTLDSYANWFICQSTLFNGAQCLIVDHKHGSKWCHFLIGYFEGIFDRLEINAEISLHGNSLLISKK